MRLLGNNRVVSSSARSRGIWSARSRGAVLWCLAIFALLQVGFYLAGQTVFPEWTDPTYGAKIVRLNRRLSAERERPFLIVALGSSRTHFGLKGLPAEKVLTQSLGQRVLVGNFGRPGGGPFSELLTLRRVLADAGRPDLVLVEVLAPLLACNAWPGDLEPTQFTPAGLRWNELSIVKGYGREVRPGLRRQWWEAHGLPSYAYRINILSDLLPNLLPLAKRQAVLSTTDETGWTDPPLENNPRVHKWAMGVAYKACSAQLQGFCLDQRPVTALHEVLKICKKEKLRTVLIVMPEGPAFRSWYPPGAWEQVKGVLDDLSRRYDVPLINAREWMTEDEFLDSHHLTPPAATGFSERLARESLAPLLDGRTRVSRTPPPDPLPAAERGKKTGTCQTDRDGESDPSARYFEHPPAYIAPSPPFPLPRELAAQQAIATEPGPEPPAGGRRR